MCLPLAFLKCYSLTAAIGSLLAGIGLLGVSIYGFTQKSMWIGGTSSSNTVIIVVILVDVGIIITSLLGIWGVKKAKPLLLFIFTILVGVFFLILFVVGIVALAGKDQVMPQDCINPGNQTWVSDINLLYSTTQLMCNNMGGLNCGCNFTIMGTYSQQQQGSISATYKNLNGPYIALQDCPFYQVAVQTAGFSAYLKYIDGLKAIESTLDCTGWCKQQFPNDLLIYKFSDVNNKVHPKGYCYPLFKQAVDTWTQVIYITCFVVAGLLFFAFIFNMCICCHPERRALKMRERFSYAAADGYHRY